MNTFLSTSQESLREQYRTFALDHIKPCAKALEEHSISLKDVLKTIGQSEFCGITVPKEYGGTGGSFLDAALFVEAISYFEPGLGLTLAVHIAVIEAIKKYGSDTHKSRFLPQLANLDIVATMAFSEREAGTDWQSVKATLKKQGSDSIVSGEKTWVVNGELATLMLLLLKDGDDLALSLADTSSQSAKDGTITISPDHGRLGLRSCYVNDIEFKNLPLSADATLGETKDSAAIALYVMDVAKILLAASCVGLTDCALDEAVEHGKTREQFGSNIGRFQAIQWKVADMSVDVQAARLQTYRAAWAHDERSADFRRFAAMAKLLASKVARIHTGEALQVLGTFGITTDSALERFYRDAKMTEICLGTSESQKLVLVEELGI